MSISTLIKAFFEKKGIEKISDLKPDERIEYDRWQAIIDGTEVTVEKIREFCKYQVKLIEEKFASGDNTDKQDAFFKASLHIYINILKLIEASEEDRKNLEKHLSSLINS